MAREALSLQKQLAPGAGARKFPGKIIVMMRQTIEGRGASIFIDSHVSKHVEQGELAPLIDNIAAVYLQFLWHHSLDRVLADELCAAVAALRPD